MIANRERLETQARRLTQGLSSASRYSSRSGNDEGASHTRGVPVSTTFTTHEKGSGFPLRRE